MTISIMKARLQKVFTCLGEKRIHIRGRDNNKKGNEAKEDMQLDAKSN